MNKKKLFIVAALVQFICGCSSGSDVNNSAANQNQVNPMMVNNPLAGGSGSGGTQAFTPEPSNAKSSAANWGSDKEQTKATIKRGRLLTPDTPQSPPAKKAAPVDPYAAHYDKWRLERAATVRSWAQVTMDPNGIDAFVKTAWSQGICHVRLAMLGPIDNLKIFTRDCQSVKITFQNQDGGTLQQFTIPTTMFKEASPGVNGGTPTIFVEGQMEIPLEMYEKFYQWQLDWQ